MEYTHRSGFKDGLADQIKKPFCQSLPSILSSEWIREIINIEGLEKAAKDGLNLPDLSNVPKDNFEDYLRGYNSGSNIVLWTETAALCLVTLAVGIYAVASAINWEYVLK